MTWLTEPLSLPFMQTALSASVLVAIVCSLLGVYVIHRRMAFIGDALAHTTLPGVAVAYYFGVNLAFGALSAAIITAVLIGWMSRKRQIQEDSAIGIVFTGMFALGIVFLSRTRTTRNLTEILLGNVLAVSASDLWIITIVTLIVISILWLFHKELELTSFDPTQAALIGLAPDTMRFLILLLLAVTIVVAIQVVGLILTTALLITPATTASIVTRSLVWTMFMSAFLAVISSTFGLILSYHLGTPSGASIVLVSVAIYILTTAYAKHIRIRLPRS